MKGTPMAKQMSVMMFGKYKGQMIDEVPTDYLIWAFGSFPKLRNKLREVLEKRGLSRNQVQNRSSRHKVLSKEPESDEKRRQRLLKPRKVRRTDQQKQANDVARAMGRQVPYPRYQQPRELRHFTRGN
jgi:hypothetical protein